MYVPKTTLVKGVAWPEFVKRKSVKDHVWTENSKDAYRVGGGQRLGEMAKALISYVREHPGATTYQISENLKIAPKLIAAKCCNFTKTGRFLAVPVHGIRGRANGFIFNEGYTPKG